MMVDYIRTKTAIPNNQIPDTVLRGEKTPFHFWDMEFCYQKYGSYRATAESVRACGLGGTFSELKDGQAANFMFSNSLHKLRHDLNYNDFSCSEIKETVDYVNGRVGIDFRESELVGRLEFAVNIEVDSPEIYLHQIGYKNATKVQMIDGSKVYGCEFRQTKNKVKSYNPILKAKLSGEKTGIEKNILRFELVTSAAELRRKKIPISKVKDLYNQDVLFQIGMEMGKTTKEIQMKPALPTDLKRRDFMIYFLFENATPEMIKNIRAQSSSTFSRDKKRYKEILEIYKIDGNDISQKVTEKWMELLGS